MIERVASVTWKRPKLVLALVGALVVAAGALGRGVEEHLTAAGFVDSASESERATAQLRDELGYDANPGVVLLVRDPDGAVLDLEDPAVGGEIERIGRSVAGAAQVGHVTEPRASRDRRSIVMAAHLTTPDVEADAADVAEDVERRVGESTLEVGIGGFAMAFSETNDQTREDLAKAELIAFPILAVLLLIVFRGVIAAAIPLVIGVMAILVTLLMLRVMAEIVDTSLCAQNIAIALSLGLAIDYGLLLVTRYREELHRSGPTEEAHRRTVLTAGRTVMFSGLTVAAALAALVVFPQRFLYSVAIAGSLAGILSGLIAILVVPSLLALLGDRINALAVRRGTTVSDASDGWHRLALGVMRRPVLVALGTSVVLLAMAMPLLSTNLTGPSAEAVPKGQPSREVNRAVEASFGRGVTEAITVTVRGDQGDAELRALNDRIASIDGIATARPFARASDDLAYANFAPEERALARPTEDAVREIRAIGAPLLVSGNTARFIDQKASMLEHLPLVLAIVGAVTFLLLFLLTGSIILPLKTLLMNVITLAATLGILVLAFQEGWLKGPLGYSGPEAIEVVTLAFLMAILFGLATDYAVLVMARIKEQHDRGATNEEAVATGIGRTGRVITAAAVMIAVVLGAFAVSPVFFMKQVAIGQAVGVLVDAMIVRALLVPALMRLFGEWNWWAPAPLKRFQRRWGFHEA